MASVAQPATASRLTWQRLLRLTALAWLAVVGFDLLMNAGLIARFNHWDQPGFLSPTKMFQYIPLGYVAFFLWCALIAWLIVRTGTVGWRAGAWFGAKFGVLLGAAGFFGDVSIFAFPRTMIFLWAVYKALACILAGGVLAAGVAAPTLRPISRWVAIFVAACLLGCALLLACGWVPRPHLGFSNVGIGWDPNR